MLKNLIRKRMCPQINRRAVPNDPALFELPEIGEIRDNLFTFISIIIVINTKIHTYTRNKCTFSKNNNNEHILYLI